MGVSTPTKGMYRLATRMASITLSAQPDAPRLKRSSFRPARPSSDRFCSLAKVPLVYMC